MMATRLIAALVVCLLLLAGAQDLSTVTFTKSATQNQLWNQDAFPLTPIPPFGRVTILNVTSSECCGKVTHFHAVIVDLDGPDPSRAVNSAVSITVTYEHDPLLAFTIPYGQFFGDAWAGESANFESALFAKRSTNALHFVAPMPFRRAISIELVSTYAHTVGGYTIVQYEQGPTLPNQGQYLMAQYSAQSIANWPFAAVRVLPSHVLGAGQLVGVSYTAATPRSDIMNTANHFAGVCEGNWNFFVDNTTQVAGNSSDPSLLSWMGSEDFFGQSFGWTPGTNLRSGTTFIQDGPTRLATYRMLVDAPIRFTTSLAAAIQWDWDHQRIPPDCLARPGACPVNFTVLTLYYVIPSSSTKT